MIKKADISDVLNSIREKGSDAAGNIGAWYAAQPEDAKRSVINSLLGAGAGAVLGGGMGMLTRHDPDEPRSSALVSPALMGALFGGLAGGGLTLGHGIASGNLKLPGVSDDSSRPVFTRATDALIRGAQHHWGALAGAALPGVIGGKGESPWATVRNLINATAEHPGISGTGRLANVAKTFRGLQPTTRLGLALIPASMWGGIAVQRALNNEY